MFPAIILSIFRSTRLCVTACSIMHPRCCRPATSWVHYTTSCNTQSSAPEVGQNNCPKHVELTGIINKPLLLHLVGCLYYLYQWCTVRQISDDEIYLLSNYIKSVLWREAKRLSYIEDARCLKVKQFKRTEYSYCKNNIQARWIPSVFINKTAWLQVRKSVLYKNCVCFLYSYFYTCFAFRQILGELRCRRARHEAQVSCMKWSKVQWRSKHN
jgi:hypothetical protein